MTTKTFQLVKLLVVIVLAILVTEAVAMRNIFLAVAGIFIAPVAIFMLRGRVKGVLADERDYTSAGTAARWAITVFAWINVVIMIALMVVQDLNPLYVPIASTLGYTLGLLMVLYTLFYRYHNRIAHLKVKWPYIFVGIFLAAAILVAGLRLFSGEDDWMCVNGQWVEHGHPSFPAPTVECE